MVKGVEAGSASLGVNAALPLLAQVTLNNSLSFPQPCSH